MAFSLAWVDWCICALVLSATLFVGLYLSIHRKSSANSSRFFLADRSLSWPLIGASLFATNIGAKHLVGLSGDAYRYGLSAGTVELTTCWTLGFAAFFLFPFYIRNRVFTTPEFLETRFHPLARVFFRLDAGDLYYHKNGVSPLCWRLGIARDCWLGRNDGRLGHGNRGGTGHHNWWLHRRGIHRFNPGRNHNRRMYGDVIYGVAPGRRVGSLKATRSRCDADRQAILRPTYPFWGVLLTAVYGGTFYWGVDQVNVQRVLGARNLDQARWGSMFTVLLKLLPVFIFALPGVIALALFPGRESKTTFVTLLNELLPTGVRGLVLAALFASLISSTLSVMNSVSTLVVRDFILHFRPHTGEHAQVRLGRFAIAAAGLLGIMAAYAVYKTPDGLYKYLQTVSLYLELPVAPAIIFGILSKRVTTAGALASVLVGSLFCIVFVTDQLIGPEAGSRFFPLLHASPLTLNYTYRGLWGSLAGVITLFAVSAFTKKTDPEKVDRLTINWKGQAERFRGIFDWRLQLAVLTAITAALYWMLR